MNNCEVRDYKATCMKINVSCSETLHHDLISNFMLNADCKRNAYFFNVLYNIDILSVQLLRRLEIL